MYTRKAGYQSVIETDVVVAGAGGSGLAAAVAAAELGAKVLVLEKRRFPGGNTAFAEGIFASESSAQKRAAIDVQNDDMFKLAMTFANWQLNGDVVRAFINKSGDTVRWLEDKGITFDVFAFSAKQLHRVFHNPPQGGPQIITALLKNCADLGVQNMYGISVKKILKDNDGKVVGVIAVGMGWEFYIKAKGVIIATGGFAGNKELLKKYSHFTTKGYILKGLPHQGDGLIMATQVGAATEGLGNIQRSGPAFPGNIGSLMAVAIEPNVLWLNKKGERFTDESNGFNDFQAVNTILREPGKFCYVLVDHKIISDIEHRGLIRVYQGSLRPSGGPMPDLQKDFQQMVEGLVPVAQVNKEECNGCGICVDLCPANALELDTRVLDKFEIPACRFSCPAGVDMRRYIYYLRSGELKKAYEIIRESLPLPAITGRVCPHFCEVDCARSAVDDAVNINALERYIADYWLHEKAKLIPKKHSAKVAIVGSGPAGLSCAYFLCRMGYPVTVFEAQSVLGGMLRIGIPEYRLPRQVLDKQIDYIKDMGVEFKTNSQIGKNINFDSLRKDYRAIFFAIGNQLSRKIKLEGDHLNGVLWGLEFLRRVNLGQKVEVKEKVVVIGGGNVALDVALMARRMGAREVRIACLESGIEMPAYEEEIKQALEESIKIHEKWGPYRVLGNDGNVTGIELIRCIKLYDVNGEFNPSFDNKVRKTIKADMVIFAIGQDVDKSQIPQELKKTQSGILMVDPLTMQTNIPGVFAAGDVASGAASVVNAIAGGHAAAISIDRYLRNEDLRKGRSIKPVKIENPPKEGISIAKRIPTPLLHPDRITGNFEEIKQGFDGHMAIQEVYRCMTCGSRSIVDVNKCHLCKSCEVQCPVHAVHTAAARKIKPLGKISRSLNEIAEWMGADSKVLTSTVSEYNLYCDRGHDPVFAKERRYLQPLRTPPYYVFKCEAVYLTTLGGIKINKNMEVVDKDGIVIPGLFAAGNDTGGWESDTYCVLLPGSTFGFALNSGRIAGENAARLASKKKAII